MPILEEQFTLGYLRFNDDTAALLRPFLSPAAEGAEFIKEWDDTSRILAEFDTLRLLLDFSHFLPSPGGSDPDRRFPPLLHAHLLGKKLGGFEVIWDAAGAEPLWAGQPRVKDGVLFFYIWASFPPIGGGGAPPASLSPDHPRPAFRCRQRALAPTALH